MRCPTHARHGVRRRSICLTGVAFPGLAVSFGSSSGSDDVGEMATVFSGFEGFFEFLGAMMTD